MFIKCENGHVYEDSCEYCPQCGSPTARQNNVSSQRRVKKLVISRESTEAEAGRTVSYSPSFEGHKHRFISGWLVCVEGSEKGRDYRIYRGFNRIGRLPGSDVSVAGEEKMDESFHCAVVYDDKSNSFALCPGKGVVSLNGEPLIKATPLKIYDRITIGKTLLEFVPFCGGNKKWE